jgi:hypothetical protein
MTDIRIEFSFLTHRKRKRLTSLLGPQGVLSLIDLWINTAQNRPKGILVGMDEIDIANDAQWSGDPKALVNALVDSGFLIQNGNGCYEIHDWDKHQRWAYFSEERSVKARESVSKRWEKIRSKKGTYTKRIRNVKGTNTLGNTPSPIPSPSPSPLPNPNPLPTQIHEESWSAFLEMRIKIKHPLTERAEKLIVKELQKLEAAGFEMNAVLDQSTRNDWRDVYAIKADKQTETERRYKY